MQAVVDRGEAVTLMEPLRIAEGSPHRAGLIDLAVTLAARSTGFRRSLPDAVAGALADLVRAMNCYYSNLIEGHDTHPVEIERALKADFSADPTKRILQREATAHIAVQRWIDAGGLDGRAATVAGLRECHRRFAAALPEELLTATDPETGETVAVAPGGLRRRDVRVGHHVPVSPGAVPRFLARFEAAYRDLGRAEAILASAVAHHRLAWIHPFLDGNGRVARLMSHAMHRESLDSGGLWSVARGLARNVAAYRDHLAACDQPRRDDRDGRGNLSEAALAEFTRFFLKTCLDQVAFMERLVDPERLRARVRLWAEEEVRIGALPPRSPELLDAVVARGGLGRGEVAALLGASARHARRVTAALIARGVLVADSSRAPLRLAFPAALAPRWLPGLFPEP